MSDQQVPPPGPDPEDAPLPHLPPARPRRARTWRQKLHRLGLRVRLGRQAFRESQGWRRVRWAGLRLAALLGALLILLVVMVGAAGWYTSRSEFCRSCHIMEPYYRSWQTSSHKDVPCIECHFPPGFGGKVRGKLLGLVQLAKYVTASEGPRPAAEIPDASCLRSGCHETRLLSGMVNYKGIRFNHKPHLGELRRGKQLRCTSCHSQIVQGKHMIVTPSTCFLCHFKEGQFNQGLGACNRCHATPETQFDLGGGAMFTHDLALKKGVDCENCHHDVIRGDGAVSRDRCVSCHNREDDLKRLDDHQFMHQVHVTDQKIDCLQCHARIEHSLEKDKILHAVGDCASCHPNHHHEQVAMLRGTGAVSVPSHATEMLAIRAECRTCHRIQEVSPIGTVLWRGSAETCSLCHDAAEVSRLQAYHQQLRAALPELQAVAQRVGKAMEAATLAPERKAAMSKQLEATEHDLVFLRYGNDIHNIHYAAKLNQVLLERLREMCRELKLEEPKVHLPVAEKPAKAPGG